MHSLLLALCLVRAGLQNQSQTPSGAAKVQTPVPTPPTVAAPAPVSSPRADSLYLAILERTNSQLSLWWNPYGVMIAALGILFAILAIVAALILWRQGKEYRNLVEQMVQQSQAVLNAYLEEKNVQLEAFRHDLSHQVASWKGELDQATGEHREKLEGLIAKVETFERTLPSAPSVTNPARNLGFGIQAAEMLAPGRGLFGDAFQAASLLRGISNLDKAAKAVQGRYKPAKECSHCGQIYNGELPSCPHCGHV